MKKHIQKIGVTRWVGRFYIVLGLVFMLAGGCIYGAGTARLAGLERTEAVILSQSSSPSFTEVQYTVNGHTYTHTLSYYTSTQRVGSTITVYYQAETPQTAYSRFPGIIVTTVFSLLGFLFAVIGAMMVLVMNRRRRRQQALLESGFYIDAEICGVAQNHSVSINSRHPYIITCRAQNPENGKTYTFKSEDFWEDPSPLLGGLRTLRVAVAPENYKHYAVDTAFLLPTETEE